MPKGRAHADANRPPDRLGRRQGQAAGRRAAGPPGLAQLAAQVALLEAAIVILGDASPNRDGLLRWLGVVGAEAEHDTPTGHAIRAAARRLSEMLGG